MPNFEFTRGLRVVLPTAFGLAAAGCSADVARFDFPSGAGFSSSQTNSIPIPPATVHSPPPRAGLLGDGDGASHASSQGDVRVAELPPAQSQGYDRGYNAGPPAGYDSGGSGGYDVAPVRSYDAAPRHSYDYDRPSRSSRAPAPRAEQVAHGDGSDIEVKQGDTLYGLSRRHGVGVSEIKSANDMKGDSLKPGQRLRMPSGRGGASSPAKYETAAVQPAVAAPEPAASTTPVAASETAGTYTMKAGDSLYAVARKHNVKYAELQSHNGITDVRNIRPGTVLKIPGQSGSPGSTVAEATPSAPAAEAVTSAPVVAEPPKSEPAKIETAAASSDAPKVLNAAPTTSPAAAVTQVAAVETKAETTPSPPVTHSASAGGDKSASGRLRWPVQGKVISAFGPRPDGTHNDGINFSVPLGTDVHVAESGEVIYVGDELKAYGKLVLVRHDNGWVTAYAHNDELKVTRGQKVSRGDVVAKAGKTGPVDQPQVHFELRQESKAVDPTSFMEKL